MSVKWMDTIWREFITKNIDDALLFFMPELAADRDYSREPVLLSNELRAIGGSSDKGARYADLALSIPLKSGADHRILLHVEQQHAYDPDFPLRMFQVYYRVSDQFLIPVTSFAIFTGDRSSAAFYFNEHYGTRVQFEYNVYEVRTANEEALKNNENIFALVILAAKRMLEAGGDPKKRGSFSFELLRLLRKRDYDDRRAKSLQLFIYRILQISDEKINRRVRRVWDMQGIPISEAVKEIWARDAIEEGMKKGREEGIEIGMEKGMEKGVEKVARSMLDAGVSPEAIQKYTGLNKENILALR